MALNLFPLTLKKKLLNLWGYRKRCAVPLMTKEDNTLWTGRDFNKFLVPLTIGITKPGGKRILSYSFRAGIPTLMARAGYSSVIARYREREDGGHQLS